LSFDISEEQYRAHWQAAVRYGARLPKSAVLFRNLRGLIPQGK
jgi:hypothetical protein